MLGILGGMGPMATVDFMAKVVRNTPAAVDQDHIQIVACSSAAIPDRTAAIFGDGPDPLPAMRDALRRLEAAGASVVAIPCNTAHHWHGALQAGTHIKILHIVDAVADELPAGFSGRIGLLASDGAIRAGVYAKRLAGRGIECMTPDAQGQAKVMRAIRLVKAGRTAEAAALLRRQAEVLADAGCGRVVMGCTEIPVALAGVDGALGAVLLDATDALARACVAAFRPVAETQTLAIAA